MPRGRVRVSWTLNLRHDGTRRAESGRAGARERPRNDEGPPRTGRPFETAMRQLLPRRIARMRRISTYSHTTVTMMPNAPTQP